ncbi:MAG: hypothetical protein NTX18_07985 [Cyanobium sp. LacPavin_0818_WC50_MAG_67_9]|nr:hypothetical protein [Cyanobium sp. LacPavin_0818_WC50_MAG_67_9]
MGGGHAGHLLQQPAPRPFRAEGVDAEGALAQGAGEGVFVEHEGPAIKPLHPEKLSPGIAPVDVAHGELLHLAPEPLPHGVEVAE